MDPQQEMADVIRGVIPSGWALLDYEASGDRLPDKQTVTLKIRSVRRIPEAPASGWQIDWILTLMTQYTSRQTADPQLSRDLLEFLLALAGADIRLKVIGADKTVGEDDDRLAYDITVQMNITSKEG